jgi:hypothetical protein
MEVGVIRKFRAPPRAQIIKYSNIFHKYIKSLCFSRWPESASELYRASYSRLSEKLVPTLADRGVSRGERDGSLRP